MTIDLKDSTRQRLIRFDSDVVIVAGEAGRLGPLSCVKRVLSGCHAAGVLPAASVKAGAIKGNRRNEC